MRHVLMICLLLLLCSGCQQKNETRTTLSHEIKDPGVTASITRVGETSKFLLKVRYDGTRDMLWWAVAGAVLEVNGKPVSRPKGKEATNWFTWIEDSGNKVDHFGAFRRDNPLIETLVLDTKVLKPGSYDATPVVVVFQKGRDANPKMREVYYSQEAGLHPEKSVGCKFIIR